MNVPLAQTRPRDLQPDAPFSPAGPAADLDTAISMACRRIAPLWPLQHFVAVNPFLGLSEQGFDQADATLRRVTGRGIAMDRAFYRARIAAGDIADTDLNEALERVRGRGQAPAPADLAALKQAIARDPTDDGAPTAVTVADLLGADASRFAVNEIAKWCAAYFDQGQAAWKMPWRGLGAFAAWRAAAAVDRTPDVKGYKGFRAAVASLPEDPRAAIAVAVDALGVPRAALDDYLHRALTTIAGWAGYARYLDWQTGLRGGEGDSVAQLLAIRLAWDHGLFAASRDEGFRDTLADAFAAMARAVADTAAPDAEGAVDLVLQEAYEAAFQRRLVARFEADGAARPAKAIRPPLQAAFCIDVRSEVYRRALETALPGADTLGFAGFFGLPIEYVPLGQEQGGAHCPVLLTPKYVVRETVAGADAEETAAILRFRLLHRKAAKAWKSFKTSAVAAFGYVETMGLTFAGKLLTDAAGLTRTVPHPDTDGVTPPARDRLAPELGPNVLAGRQTGLSPEERLDAAESILKAMGLTERFGRLVLLVGHGSTTVNNPHASGLDCGACGGHSGEANARLTAAILNDPEVRAGLAARGIAVPEDTLFLGALHDTTTDDVTLFDRDTAPASHAEDLREAEAALTRASRLARRERAPDLGIDPDAPVDSRVDARAHDWSQVRPEWGLAGNAAFVAAPRARTAGLDLGGRAFLHNYDWQADRDWGNLELIMTAPMVVASWINLQYYGSTVDNARYGSGNKVLHNVVGTLGVLEGNGGDLRSGLPWQSVHDGERYVHEPLRLNVMIEAPIWAIDRIVSRHENVRELVDNGWVHLFALGGEGRTCHRYRGKGRWQALSAPVPDTAVA